MGAKNEQLAEQADLAAGTRTFKSVNGKSLENDDSKAGGITFIRPKELADAGTTGVVAEGIFEGTLPNSFDDAKSDYKVRTESGNLIVLNSTGSLASQMAKVAVGSYVQIQYLGMKPITAGKMKGKMSHSYIVGIAD
jgi:hypothetical protein